MNNGNETYHYPTPMFDDIAPRFTKAKVFLVVDAKDGFLQLSTSGSE